MKTATKNTITDHCTNAQIRSIEKVLPIRNAGVVIAEKYDENNNIQKVYVVPTSLDILKQEVMRTVASQSEETLKSDLKRAGCEISAEIEVGGVHSTLLLSAFITYFFNRHTQFYLPQLMDALLDASNRMIMEGKPDSIPYNTPCAAAALVLNHFYEREGIEPKIVRIKYRKDIRKGEPVDVVFDIDTYTPPLTKEEEKIKDEISSLLSSLKIH